MYRLRKKSESKRSLVVDPLRIHQPPAPLPPLPPADDFRTSLILPDLTRRFSVLRSSSGIPIGLDDLKNKFAEHRARGAENQLSEEEEDMILEALGRLHARTDTTKGSRGGSGEGSDRGSQVDGADDSLESRQSVQSSSTTADSVLRNAPSISSLSSTKGSNVSRRMSNNLFGSGKFRDQAYLRTANYGRRSGTTRAAPSVSHSESMISMNSASSSRAALYPSIYSDSQSLRPSTPEGSTYTPSGSAPSSPDNNKTFEKGRARIRSDFALETRALDSRLSRALSPEGLRRASLALDEVIRELEEEGDDEIVMERSPISYAPSVAQSATLVASERNSPLPSPSDYDAGTALSSDEQVVSQEAQRESPYPRSRTVSPTPRLPGYIPGMPRPMTPRETSFDSDDLTPSTTPRATSPRLPGASNRSTSVISASLALTSQTADSNASPSRQSPRPTSPPAPVSTPPLFFNRTTNGRFTPEDRQRNGSTSPIEKPESPVLGRRRPNSPLAGPAYQPLTSMSSRPGTPSNVIWNMPTPTAGPKSLHGRNGSSSGHSRNGSITSISDSTFDTLERSKSTSRSLRSPALPESPWIDDGVPGTPTAASSAEYRPPSAMSGMDLSSPIQMTHRAQRSPTPTHNHSKSSSSSTYAEPVQATNGDGHTPSRRSSKQQHHSSFSLASPSPHALLFSPIANSSRSSIESTGSSYHSWDEDHKKDRLFNLFSNLDPQYKEWHDLSAPQKSNPSTPGTSPYEGLEAEDYMWRNNGLTKGDFVAIQDKLINTALTKATTPDGRARASSLRRRRPSTSQSNYSYNGGENRVTSPTPQPQGPTAAAARAAMSDHIAKASALLNSVVDSIESPRSKPSVIPNVEDAPQDALYSADFSVSSPSRRHRALADALFGVEDKGRPETPTDMPMITVVADRATTQELDTPAERARAQMPPTFQSPPARSTSMRKAPPGQSSPMPTSPRVDANLLAFDVQQRAEAATAALRKSPSIPKIAETGTVQRKRIHPKQISSPRLVSASTSVDTIPLQSPPMTSGHNNHPSNKIGSRLKRLRGTLRAKPSMPEGEEITPYPLDLRTPPPVSTPPSVPTPTLSTTNLELRLEPVITSATEVGRFKVAAPTVVPSPPASATPGLKGFMARFRKQRATDAYPSPQRLRPDRATPSSTTSATSLSPSASPPLDRSQPQAQVVRSAPSTQTGFRSPSPGVTQSPPSRSPIPRLSGEAVRSAQQLQMHTDEAALKQLFDAANNLGLDQAALNDLIARSPSTSSRSTAWTKLTRATSVTDSRKSHMPSIRGSVATDGLISTPISEGRPSIEGPSSRPSTDTRHLQAPSRKPSDATPRPRPAKGTENAINPVVRRTIIYPSDSRASTIDLQALMRKQSASRRRRSASAASVHSTRSIHDRVPTPPLHKSGGRRFSTDGSPPVPQLPPSLSAADTLALPSQMEKSSSTYDSLYEMYAGENKPAIVINSDSQGASGSQPLQADTIAESGPALEVIEMANGETIWSIVNGLRDDDEESFYGDRTSFYSEYSVNDNSDGVKVFFKEHERKSSKGSNSSFLSRKRQQVPKGSSRPETKVFFSSSAQIGRLIENLSRGMDAGSFNITPDHQQAHLGHSAQSSVGSEVDMRWTVEERLEQMLGSMGSSS